MWRCHIRSHQRVCVRFSGSHVGLRADAAKTRQRYSSSLCADQPFARKGKWGALSSQVHPIKGSSRVGTVALVQTSSSPLRLRCSWRCTHRAPRPWTADGDSTILQAPRRFLPEYTCRREDTGRYSPQQTTSQTRYCMKKIEPAKDTDAET